MFAERGVFSLSWQARNPVLMCVRVGTFQVFLFPLMTLFSAVLLPLLLTFSKLTPLIVMTNYQRHQGHQREDCHRCWRCCRRCYLLFNAFTGHNVLAEWTPDDVLATPIFAMFHSPLLLPAMETTTAIKAAGTTESMC